MAGARTIRLRPSSNINYYYSIPFQEWSDTEIFVPLKYGKVQILTIVKSKKTEENVVFAVTREKLEDLFLYCEWIMQNIKGKEVHFRDWTEFRIVAICSEVQVESEQKTLEYIVEWKK